MVNFSGVISAQNGSPKPEFLGIAEAGILTGRMPFLKANKKYESNEHWNMTWISSMDGVIHGNNLSKFTEKSNYQHTK